MLSGAARFVSADPLRPSHSTDPLPSGSCDAKGDPSREKPAPDADDRPPSPRCGEDRRIQLPTRATQVSSVMPMPAQRRWIPPDAERSGNVGLRARELQLGARVSLGDLVADGPRADANRWTGRRRSALPVTGRPIIPAAQRRIVIALQHSPDFHSEDRSSDLFNRQSMTAEHVASEMMRRRDSVPRLMEERCTWIDASAHALHRRTILDRRRSAGFEQASELLERRSKRFLIRRRVDADSDAIALVQ